LKESNIIDSLAHSERPKEACAYMSPLSLEETPSQDHMKVETNNESIFAYIYIYIHTTQECTSDISRMCWAMAHARNRERPVVYICVSKYSRNSVDDFPFSLLIKTEVIVLVAGSVF
jgi:hypothetical protein